MGHICGGTAVTHQVILNVLCLTNNTKTKTYTYNSNIQMDFFFYIYHIKTRLSLLRKMEHQIGKLFTRGILLLNRPGDLEVCHETYIEYFERI